MSVGNYQHRAVQRKGSSWAKAGNQALKRKKAPCFRPGSAFLKRWDFVTRFQTSAFQKNTHFPGARRKLFVVHFLVRVRQYKKRSFLKLSWSRKKNSALGCSFFRLSPEKYPGGVHWDGWQEAQYWWEVSMRHMCTQNFSLTLERHSVDIRVKP